MAKVGVIGVPKFAVWSDRHFLPDGMGMVARQPKKTRRHWSACATDTNRRDLVQMLIGAGRVVDSNEFAVSDLGELLMKDSEDPSCISDEKSMGGYDNIAVMDAYRALGAQLRVVINAAAADVVLVMGGDHSGALPLYTLPGHVVRLDAHGDAYGSWVDGNLYSPLLGGATYMNFVQDMGLKEDGEVWNAGIVDIFERAGRSVNVPREDYLGCFGRVLSTGEIIGRTSETGLLDVDVDVLSEVYGLPHPFNRSNLTVEELTGVITRLNPRVIGLFECIKRDGSMPPDIVSSHSGVFGPICRAVAEVAMYRSHERLAEKA